MNKNKDKILEYLKKNKGIINIKQISKNLQMSYPTAQRYIGILEAEGKIQVNNLGNTKLIEIKR